MRLEGVSAIDRYMPIHAALHAHEQRDQRPPAPSAVRWPSAALSAARRPAERRALVKPGARRAALRGPPRRAGRQAARHARAELEHAIAAATDDAGPPVEIVWSGGQFAPCEIAVDDRWVQLVRDAARGRARRPAAGRRRRLRDGHAPVPRARHPLPHVRPARHPARARRRRARRDRELETVARVIVRCAVAFAARLTQPLGRRRRAVGRRGRDRRPGVIARAQRRAGRRRRRRRGHLEEHEPAGQRERPAADRIELEQAAARRPARPAGRPSSARARAAAATRRRCRAGG